MSDHGKIVSSRSISSMKGKQALRAAARLNLQKSKRDGQIHARRDRHTSDDADEEVPLEIVGDIDGGEGEIEIEYSNEAYKEFNRIAKGGKYRCEVCLPEIMIEVPSDLETNWFCKLKPSGKQVLVKSASNKNRGQSMIKTNIFCAMTGKLLFNMLSNIPCNTVLEAIWQENVVHEDDDDGTAHMGFSTKYNSIHVLDVMCYNGQWLQHTTLEFREFWLSTRFSDEDLRAFNDPAMETEALQNNTQLQLYSLQLCQTLECTYNTLLNLYTSTENNIKMSHDYGQGQYYVRSDGFLFCHKESHYEVGTSPLVLHFQDENVTSADDDNYADIDIEKDTSAVEPTMIPDDCDMDEQEREVENDDENADMHGLVSEEDGTSGERVGTRDDASDGSQMMDFESVLFEDILKILQKH